MSIHLDRRERRLAGYISRGHSGSAIGKGHQQPALHQAAAIMVLVLGDDRIFVLAIHHALPQRSDKTEEATGLDDAACEAGPNRDLPLVSVRTLLPLAEYVRARLSSAREEVDGTSGPAADPAVRTGIAGSLADPRPQGVADDDAESTAAAGAGVGSAAPISSGRN